MKKLISTLLCGAMIASSLGIFPSKSNLNSLNSEITVSAATNYGGLYYVTYPYALFKEYYSNGRYILKAVYFNKGDYISISSSGTYYFNGVAFDAKPGIGLYFMKIR